MISIMLVFRQNLSFHVTSCQPTRNPCDVLTPSVLLVTFQDCFLLTKTFHDSVAIRIRNTQFLSGRCQCDLPTNVDTYLWLYFCCFTAKGKKWDHVFDLSITFHTGIRMGWLEVLSSTQIDRYLNQHARLCVCMSVNTDKRRNILKRRSRNLDEYEGIWI